jgi:1-acyl-sn-glycerol-3-phosphate acyltransferase
VRPAAPRASSAARRLQRSITMPDTRPTELLPDPMYRLWMSGLHALGGALLRTGYRLRIEGNEHLPARGGALVVSNHVAMHDWLFVGVALDRPLRFVMHQHHFKYPLLRAFFGASRVIPIAPAKQDPARLAEAMEAIDRALADGEVVALWPEGRMSEDGALGPFRPGLERILAKRPVPVVPVAVDGLFGSRLSRAPEAPPRLRAEVRVRVGAPMTGEVTSDAVRSTIERMLRGAAPPPIAQSAGPQCPAL